MQVADEEISAVAQRFKVLRTLKHANHRQVCVNAKIPTQPIVLLQWSVVTVEWKF